MKEILALLDSEIASLKEARQLLKADATESAVPRKAGRPRKAESALPTDVIKTAKTKKKRNLSPEGRARIAEAVDGAGPRRKRSRSSSQLTKRTKSYAVRV
jgi:hypothetical protein